MFAPNGSYFGLWFPCTTMAAAPLALIPPEEITGCPSLKEVSETAFTHRWDVWDVPGCRGAQCRFSELEGECGESIGPCCVRERSAAVHAQLRNATSYAPAPRVAVIGAARDAGAFLPHTLRALEELDRELFGAAATFVFAEDGSRDATRGLLERFCSRVSAQRCTVLPPIAPPLPPDPVICGDDRRRPGKCAIRRRAARIAFARKSLLDELRRSGAWERVEQLIVTDMDNRPGHVFADGLRVLLAAAGPRGPWAAAFPAHGYDTWALRPLDVAPPRPAVPGGWDCDANALVRDANFRGLWSRVCAQDGCLTCTTPCANARPGAAPLPPEPVEVASAFNGIGVYDRAAVGNCTYAANGDCEHVSLHSCMRAHGGRLAVYPRVRTVEWHAVKARAEDGARAGAMAMKATPTPQQRPRDALAPAPQPARLDEKEVRRLVSALTGRAPAPKDGSLRAHMQRVLAVR